jgi:hypothetical protein
VQFAAAGDCDEWIRLRRLHLRLKGFEMHPDQRPDNFEVTEFFRADIEQEIASVDVVDATQP